MVRTAYMWLIQDADGHMNVWTMSRTRSEAIKTYTGNFVAYTPWRFCKRQYGTRCIRVEIRPAGGGNE